MASNDDQARKTTLGILDKVESAAKRVWRDPVWSAVIAAILVSIVFGAWATVGQRWHAIGRWLIQSTPTPNGAILAGTLILILSSILYARATRREIWRKRELTLDQSDYTSDVFSGDMLDDIEWHWTYTVMGAVNNIMAVCKYCGMQLIVHRQPELVSYQCDGCRDFCTQSFGWSEAALEDIVRRLIERNLRTGQWEKRVMQ